MINVEDIVGRASDVELQELALQALTNLPDYVALQTIVTWAKGKDGMEDELIASVENNRDGGGE